MNVYSNHDLQSHDPINFLGFEQLAEKGAPDLEFYYGGHPNPKIFESSDKRKIFFSTEEQAWAHDTTDSCLAQVEKILTICPTDRAKRQLVFFPFNENYIPNQTEKVFDAIYCGSIDNHNREIPEVISKFNYRFVGWGGDPKITNHNASYQDKLNLIAQSKITICHSLTANLIGTQVKTRYFEAAAGRSLIICKKDAHNVIENFFEPNKEFFYYETAQDLEVLILGCLKNYEALANSVVEAAHQRMVNNYTTRHFVERYLQ